jgi:hypothetical protein
MALTFVKRRDASFLPRSHQQIENAEAALPVPGLRILHAPSIEGARKLARWCSGDIIRFLRSNG